MPGFLIMKVRHYVREFHRDETFASSVTSLAFSLLALALWLVLNIAWETNQAPGGYPFKNALSHLILKNRLDLLFRPNAIVALFSYLGVFLVILVGVFMWHWSLYGHFVMTRLVGFHNKTAFLTPWEDLPSLSVGKWVAIETAQDYTYVGLIHFMSHHPYEREIILTGSASQSIQTYFARQEQTHSVQPKFVYVRGDSIRAVAIIDTGTTKSLKINSFVRSRKSKLTLVAASAALKVIRFISRIPHLSLTAFFSLGAALFLFSLFQGVQILVAGYPPPVAIVGSFILSLCFFFVGSRLCKVIRRDPA